ncbi:MAG TPA: extracellular solute-binding protein, partial [Desulfobacteraceae bacterium]|nr:extracellular solute-binding protein [Desulfobacteraceae bacterium]
MKTIACILLFAGLLLIAGIHSTNAREQITFWTTEVEKDRLEIQKEIAAEFTKKHNIEVRVVPVGENHLAERTTAAFAAKSLPDVIYHPLDYTVGWADEGILDSRAATGVVNSLGEKTFSRGPLSLVQVEGGYGAVPADGWGQLLLYRKDLFNEKDLAPPDSWNRILTAAEALHDPPRMWGFEAATDPSQVYMQQVFEHFALSNNVKLTTKEGEVDLNTPAMLETLEFYKALTSFSPPGNLYWLHTRMDYLSGRAAMIIWSPFILDELSGLRRDQPVVPDIARKEQGWLARNTGFITSIRGPSGEAQYGQPSYFGISCDANKEAAGKWVQFLLTEGYLKWLAIAAEGKLPLRKGTPERPDFFVEGWINLEFGGASGARISRFYGMDVVRAIVDGADNFDRWGFKEGKGPLIFKIYRTKVISEVIKRFLDNEITATEAAEMMDRLV